MSVLDTLAEVACGMLRRDEPELNAELTLRETASIAWRLARSATVHPPLLAATTCSSCSCKLDPSGSWPARDLVTLAWSSARPRWSDEPSLATIPVALQPWLQDRNARDLTNLAWGSSASQHVDQLAMASTARRSTTHTSLFDPRQPASIAQARAGQTLAGAQQMSHLMETAVSYIDALPAQQVGWLADACQSVACSERSRRRVLQRLYELTSQLGDPLGRLSCSENGFHSSAGPLLDFAELASRLGADQLGHLGSRQLLESQGISLLSPSRPEIHVSSRRAQVVAQCRFAFADKKGSYSALSGLSDGLRAQRWLAPVTLSVGGAVDRSLCAEFQVLAQVCDTLLEDLSFPERRQLSGKVQLCISAPPCLSCVAAMCQFHLLFPSADLEVSWISDLEQPSQQELSVRHGLLNSMLILELHVD